MNPPIVPLVAFNTPAVVTLNGAEENVACPNWIPSSPSAIKILLLLPSVILFPLGFNSKFVAVNEFELKVNPPIVPLSAFSTPALVTLNGALLNVAWPNCIPSSPSAIKMVLPVPKVILLPLGSRVKFVAVSVLVLKVNPPIVPLSAFNTPPVVTLNGALPNVACPNCIPSSPSAMNILLPLPNVILLPLGFNSKFVAVKVFVPKLKPPILPPVNNTCEPVISPLAFTLKLVVDMNLWSPVAEPLIKKFVPLKAWSSVVNPPIKPALAVIVPWNTAPLACNVPESSTAKLGPNFT